MKELNQIKPYDVSNINTEHKSYLSQLIHEPEAYVFYYHLMLSFLLWYQIWENGIDERHQKSC